MKSRHFAIAIPALLLSVAALASGSHGGGHGEAAIGKPGVASKVTRTITIDMRDDMKFHTSVVDAKQGETIRFIAKNSGKVKHEMVLGSMEELKEHAALMRKMPEMEHDDPNAVSVEPGKTGSLVWRFTRSGTFDFACLVAGHFEAGMLGKIDVADVARK